MENAQPVIVNTGGRPLPRKRTPQKRVFLLLQNDEAHKKGSFFSFKMTFLVLPQSDAETTTLQLFLQSQDIIFTVKNITQVILEYCLFIRTLVLAEQKILDFTRVFKILITLDIQD